MVCSDQQMNLTVSILHRLLLVQKINNIRYDFVNSLQRSDPCAEGLIHLILFCLQHQRQVSDPITLLLLNVFWWIEVG
jgi:hypothetical protein